MRINAGEIVPYAERYSYTDDSRLLEIGELARRRQYLTQEELIEICTWKSPRSAHHATLNNFDFVEKVTNISLTTDHPQLQVDILTLLCGVGYPTASTILHFSFPDKYTIIDYRALYSIGMNTKNHQIEFNIYNYYNRLCLDLAKNLELPLRVVDKGLWQYSKENQ